MIITLRLDSHLTFSLVRALVLPILVFSTLLLNSCDHEPDLEIIDDKNELVFDSLSEHYLELIKLNEKDLSLTGDSVINEAAAYFKKTNNRNGIAMTLLTRAYRADIAGDYPAGLQFIDSALLMVDDFSTTQDLIELYNCAGIINTSLGNNGIALEMYDQVYELAMSINDTTGMIYALGNTALVYSDIQDLENSKKAHYKSYKLSAAINDYYSMAIYHLNFGFYYLKEEEIIDSAYHHNLQAFALMNEHCFEDLRTILTANSAEINNRKGKSLTALNDLTEALADNSEPIMPRDLVIAKIILARTENNLQQYDQALTHLKEADELVEEMKDWWLKMRLNEGYYHTYKAMGNDKLALRYFRSYTEIEEEQTGIKAQLQIARLRNQSLERQKEGEIASLNLTKFTQQARMDRNRYAFYFTLLAIFLVMQLYYINYRNHKKATFATKEKLIAEGKLAILRSRVNPDFILNSFTGVQSYLLKPDRMQAYSYLGKFASFLRTVINSNGEIFNDIELEIVILTEFLELEAMRFPGDFTYTVNTCPVLEEANYKTPGMIIQPYVESAIKGKLADKGQPLHLIINFNKTAEGLTVSILDGDSSSPPLLVPADKKRLTYLRQIGYENARVEINNRNEVLIYLPTI